MVMFSGKMLDLVPRVTYSRGSLIIDNNVRINFGSTQGNVPFGDKKNVLAEFEYPGQPDV